MDIQKKMANRQQRFEYIKLIMKNNHNLKSQQEFLEILKDTYGIEIGQSAISKDLSELGIAEDKETGIYKYIDQDAKYHKARAEIGDLFLEAEIERLPGKMKGLILKGNRVYLELIASKLEELLERQDVSIASILGLNGSLFIYYDSKDRDVVKQNLNQIQKHVNKKGANGAK